MKALRDAAGRRLCSQCGELATVNSYCQDCKRVVDRESAWRRRHGLARVNCTRCGVEHQRKHTWCNACAAADERQRRHAANRDGSTHFERYTKAAASKPPAPPPGFRESDLRTGKPLA